MSYIENVAKLGLDRSELRRDSDYMRGVRGEVPASDVDISKPDNPQTVHRKRAYMLGVSFFTDQFKNVPPEVTIDPLMRASITYGFLNAMNGNDPLTRRKYDRQGNVLIEFANDGENGYFMGRWVRDMRTERLAHRRFKNRNYSPSLRFEEIPKTQEDLMAYQRGYSLDLELSYEGRANQIQMAANQTKRERHIQNREPISERVWDYLMYVAGIRAQLAQRGYFDLAPEILVDPDILRGFKMSLAGVSLDPVVNEVISRISIGLRPEETAHEAFLEVVGSKLVRMRNGYLLEKNFRPKTA